MIVSEVKNINFVVLEFLNIALALCATSGANSSTKAIWKNAILLLTVRDVPNVVNKGAQKMVNNKSAVATLSRPLVFVSIFMLCT
tara:strand:+ start:2702 stop:2956 length:255 start_codon:yes stop_codon:yes gene_type:complete